MSDRVAAPDPALRAAAAHVFVADLDAPVLCEEDARHLARVLRLRPGEPVTAGDGAGGWRPCRVVEGRVPDGRRRGGRPGLALEPTGDVRRSRAPAPAVTVALASAKGDRPDWAAQKLTELGVDRIVLLATARAAVRWDGERAEAALGRLRRVARQAAMQSRRLWLPDVGPLLDVAGAVALAGTAGCAADAGGGPLRLDLPFVLVGPEGGWEPGELPDGLPRVGLGPHVLRTETAAVAAAGALCLMRAGLVGTVPEREE